MFVWVYLSATKIYIANIRIFLLKLLKTSSKHTLNNLKIKEFLVKLNLNVLKKLEILYLNRP